MKTLILLRHSKSEFATGVKDSERELLDRGIMDGFHKSIILKELNPNIDSIVASTAKRTQQTAVMMADKIEFDVEKIIYNEEMYLCSTPKMLQIINQLDDKLSNVLIVAHNPGITYIADYLSSNENFNHVPTSGMICLEFDIDSWQEVSENLGTVKWFDFSKNENR